MASKLTADQISGKLLQGSFSRSGPTVDQLPDPIVDTPMVLTLDEMKAFEQNPRTVTNAKYKEIKDSIRQRGLDHRPSVTRRPGEQKFTINNGGNTRLQILRELYSETGEDRFYRHNVLFRPWDSARGEIIALTGHLSENDLRGSLMFIERAVGIENARAIYEKEAGESISQRELVRKLSADGYPVSQSHISKMQDTVRCLLPVIPSALYSGLGKHQVERLLSLRKAAGQTWLTHTEGKEHIPDFEGLFQDVLSLFDGDASEFVYERVQDELISHMQSGTELSYEQLLLTLSENQNQARRSAVIDTPVSLTPPQQPQPGQDDRLDGDRGQAPGIEAHPPEPGKKKEKPEETPRPAKNKTGDISPPQAPELSEEERAARLAGHIVSPISTTERVQDVKRQLAALDGEHLPDFKTNALISIPVQAGGLHPISDVWYIERILDQPDELRPVIAQLAREIAHLSGINPDSVIDVPGGLGFLCQDPPEDVDLSDLANNVLTLLQSISGVYAIALIKESPEQPLDVSEFQFTAALAQLLLGSPRYEDCEAILQGRLDDTCIVKLFRLIRLGRRLVELEMQSVSVVQTP
ncbi:ParB family protein [Pseudomonas amygdali]|uniref:ParB family protein n=1 Tax=Pseudomonas amygdali TaxID=47877 RepID=UPI0001CC324E|nr:ParB family protein [Pseudomonas amygdali]KWT15005.1 chromosome partitioning protein ParB [Pseudomonas amygdali pv. aesculi]KWT16512.1 chromosome partitioning protein ParB [Pseudomonas amygdali pv. aesculi]KWT26651.1 chromosome partitioning protein ParB [Pseudomonas amygdali pv. aesculi]KWT31807.1 chromosome partitioning protein ParB [Pseudomonas amygdali pv. aesculi]KWT37312.1 chromosome partitioning protein ParB [Pseudomonas amygdali pv. aesculi]